MNHNLLREYIRKVLISEYQSHTYHPEIGDRIVNVNTGCKHYQSRGEVLDVKDADSSKDSGKIIVYLVTNNGDNFSIGDVLSKTLDQLAPERI